MGRPKPASLPSDDTKQDCRQTPMDTIQNPIRINLKMAPPKANAKIRLSDTITVHEPMWHF